MRTDIVSHADITFIRPKTTLWLRPFVLFAAVLAMALPCRALQVSPTYQTFSAKAGQTVKGQMTLTNNEEMAVTITPGVKEWFKLAENEAFAVESWLKLDETDEFELQPGESRLIKYRMSAPKKAKGELVGAVTFATKPRANMLTLQLSVVQYVAVKGTEKLDVDVANFGVEITTETRVGVLVKNSGNVHVRPRGYVYINDLKGKRMANVEILVNQPTFPGDSRVYAGTVKRFRLPKGEYEARIELLDVDRAKDFPVSTKRFNILEGGRIHLP